MLTLSGRFPAGERSNDMQTRPLKTTACLLGLGALAMATAAQSAGAATGDLQPTLQETISTGAAAANPVISLDAEFASAKGVTLAKTGTITYGVDARHLSPSAWDAMMKAPAGTRLGTFSSKLTGDSPTNMVLQGVGNDAQGAYVRATIGIDIKLSKGIGSSTVPVIMRMVNGGKQLTIMVDLRTPVSKLSALGIDTTLRTATLTLQGTLAYGAALHPITLNPSKVTVLTNAVAAQACATATCSTLRTGTPASATSVHLPKAVSLNAPAQLSYGYRYSIGGTGQPGDHVTLSVLAADGTLLASPWGAYVRPDGTFEVRATVRSGFGTDDALVRPAAARYVASATEGRATVLAAAASDTAVKLVTPIFHIQRKDAGSKLHLVVRVPGADTNTSVRVMLGNRTIAQGTTSAAGRFSATVATPINKGNLRVVASVPGADKAISQPIPFSITS
jgi:hypothetical protein